MLHTKSVEKIKTHFVLNNIVLPDRPRMIIRHTRIACWLPKATKTQSDIVMFIALPLQQWLYERTSLLRYTNSACLEYP